MDVQAYLPGDAAIARINRSVDEYNSRRAELYSSISWRRPVLLGGYAALGLALLVVLMIRGNSMLFGIAFVAVPAGFIGLWGLVCGPAARLRRSFRYSIIPQAFGFIDEVVYKNGATPASFQNLPRAAVGAFNQATFDDSVKGMHNRVAFEVFETVLFLKVGRSMAEVYRGLVLAVRLDKPFPGVLVATKNVGGVTRFLRDVLGKGGLEQVDSGDPEIDELYELRSTAPDDARRLMSSGLLDALDVLGGHWSESAGRVAIAGSDAYVLLPTRRNFFEIPNISTECDYERHIRPLVSDIGYLLSIAEQVKRAVDA